MAKKFELPTRKNRDHAGIVRFDVTLVDDRCDISWEVQVHAADGTLTDRVRNGELDPAEIAAIQAACNAVRSRFVADTSVKPKKDEVPAEPEVPA